MKVLIALVAMALGGIVAVTMSVALPSGTTIDDSRIARVRRGLLVWRVGGLVVAGVAAAVALWFGLGAPTGGADGALGAYLDGPGWFGYTRSDLRVLVCAVPAIFIVVQLIAIAVAERRSYRPVDSAITVTLSPRRAVDYLPAGLVAVTGAAALSVIGIVVVTVLNTGTVAPGLGVTCRDGTVLAKASWSREELMVLTGGILAGAVAFVLAVRSIVDRGRPDSDAMSTAADDLVRRSSATSAAGLFACLVAVTGAAVALVTGVAVRHLAGTGCGSDWWTVSGWVLYMSTGAWIVLFVWGAAAAANRTRRGAERAPAEVSA
ncbi:MAG: hypothetical protein LBE07_03370 [Gordonia sp. (in: high G+C Gram-positive bacteria)]|nr:hypothetical protein [Gordonia sp. (in: high G+C Gram-positive bacteria)]